MPLPKQSELPVAPNRAAAPPITPSQPSYEQQQIRLQQQQIELLRSAVAQRSRGVFGWMWLGVRIVVGVLMALIILIPVTQCSLREYEANKNGNTLSR
jgi:hypothetical protein